MLAGDTITLAGRSCRPSCADWSACAPYLPYGVHGEFMSVPSSSWLTSGKPPPVAYACDTYHAIRAIRVTISAKNRLCLQPVMISGMSCVCAELRGSGKLAGDRGGNAEPRVAVAWMQGRSTLQATDVQPRRSLRSAHNRALQPRRHCSRAAAAAAAMQWLQCQVSWRGHACGSI